MADDDDDEEAPALLNVNPAVGADDYDDGDEEAPELVLVGDDDDGETPLPRQPPANIDRQRLPPVPVTILTGFLGSGKTTFVRRVLSDPTHGLRVAVIENEFGGGDDSQLSAGGGGAMSPEERERLGLSVESLIARDGSDGKNLADLIELPNGCVCCTVKDSLVSALEALLDRMSDLDYVLIEASGMANPGPIASVFWLDDALGSRLRLDGVVCCVDARNLLSQLEETSSSSSSPHSRGDGKEGGEEEGGEEAARQIAFADRIIVNKTDLILLPPSDESESAAPPADANARPRRGPRPARHTLQDVLDAVKAINPAASLRATTYSDVGDDMVGWALGAGCFDSKRARETEEMLEKAEEVEKSAVVEGVGDDGHEMDGCGGGEGCSHDDCSHEGNHNHSHDHSLCRPRDDSSVITPPSQSHSHSHSSVGTVALVRRGSVSLRSVNTWLASVLWPDQDEDDRVLRARLEELMTREESASDHTAATSTALGIGATTAAAGRGGRKGTVMSVFRIKGILSVRHMLDDKGKVILDDVDSDDEDSENDQDSAVVSPTGLDRRRYIVQAVNDLWEIQPAGRALRWPDRHSGVDGGGEKEEEGRVCKLVVIGRNLDGAVLEEGFGGCFVEAPPRAPVIS